MDALGIETVVAGFDWEARTADVVAALRPERRSTPQETPKAFADAVLAVGRAR